MQLFTDLHKWMTGRPLTRRSTAPGPTGRFRPHLEGLEERALPSAYYAATTSDLIADINAANMAGGANTIVLTAPTTSPYALTAANNGTDGANGLPVIFGGTKKVAADNLTIIGNGDTIERSTGSAFRLFDVANGGSLTLENMTLQNGLAYGGNAAAQGGAVRNLGTLTLSQVTVYSNEALGFAYQSKNGKQVSPGNAAGGGIWSAGSLTIENQSVIEKNSVIGVDTGSGYGGGIAIAGGTADISNSTVGSLFSDYYYGNTALGGYESGSYVPLGPEGGFGGGIYVASGTATFTNDSIQSNSAGSYIDELFDGFDNLGQGGGLYIAKVATVYLDTYTLYSTVNNTGFDPAATTDIYGSYTLL